LLDLLRFFLELLYLFQIEHGLAFGALGFHFACLGQQPSTLWAWLEKRPVPNGELALGVLIAPEEGPPAFGTALDQFAVLTFGAFDSDLYMPWCCDSQGNYCKR